MTADASASARPALSVWDAVSLIVGIVIGSSIYETPPLIYGNVASPLAALGLWLVGGLLSLLGAVVYAELATTYPRCGGDYVYLTRAYGSWLGFLFGWAQLVVVQTGSIGALAYIFARYARSLWDLPESAPPWLAAGAVVALTLFNVAGLRMGARLQNGLTLIKLVGLLALIAAGLIGGRAESWAFTAPVQGPGWQVSLILVLYAYGGWSDAAFVAAEVRDVERNIPRALLGGIGLIALTYLLVNLAYLRALGGDGLRNTSEPAAETLALWLGPAGGDGMSLLVMLSALGGVNGLILSVSRLHATVGADHRLFRWLGRYSRREAPIGSLLLQAAMTVGIILTVGTDGGRQFIDGVVRGLHLPAVQWDKYHGGFNTLVAGSAPAFWLFFLLNAVGFFVLRWKDRDLPRPFRAWFPFAPLAFAAMCGFGLYSSVSYAWSLLPVMVLPVLSGVPLYFVSLLWDRGATADSTSVSPRT